MKYAQHRSNMDRQPPSKKRKIFAITLIVIGVAFIIYSAFGIKNKMSDDVIVDEQADVVEVMDKIIEDDSIDYESIELFAVDGFEGYGTSRRGVSGDLFTHVVVADLPEIDLETHFYEGWLVKPGVVEFFSTGEMFTRTDGKWGLVWEVSLDESDVDVFEYSKVVITLEPRDDDPAPAVDHVIEGEF